MPRRRKYPRDDLASTSVNDLSGLPQWIRMISSGSESSFSDSESSSSDSKSSFSSSVSISFRTFARDLVRLTKAVKRLQTDQTHWIDCFYDVDRMFSKSIQILEMHMDSIWDLCTSTNVEEQKDFVKRQRMDCRQLKEDIRSLKRRMFERISGSETHKYLCSLPKLKANKSELSKTKPANSKYDINQQIVIEGGSNEELVPIVIKDDSDEEKVGDDKLFQNSSLIITDNDNDDDETPPIKLNDENGIEFRPVGNGQSDNNTDGVETVAFVTSEADVIGSEGSQEDITTNVVEYGNDKSQISLIQEPTNTGESLPVKLPAESMSSKHRIETVEDQLEIRPTNSDVSLTEERSRMNVTDSKSTDLKPYACKFCGKILKRKCQINRHEKIHTGEECTITCNNKINANFANEYKIVQNNNNPWSFKICKNYTGVQVHNAKLFVCQICGKKFHNSSSINRHKKSHTNEKEWSCEICEKKFSQKCHKNRHMQIHMSKNYKCSICARS